MQAVLTHRLFADAEAGEPLSLLCDLDLLALGMESTAEGKSLVGVWWSDSSSILVSPAILLLGDAIEFLARGWIGQERRRSAGEGLVIRNSIC